jgi:uncharacterized coiled-coil protein SlyX
LAKTPTNQILAAIEAVRELQDVVAKHTEVIEKLASRLDLLEARLKAIEGAASQPRP